MLKASEVEKRYLVEVSNALLVQAHAALLHLIFQERVPGLAYPRPRQTVDGLRAEKRMQDPATSVRWSVLARDAVRFR